MINKTTLTKLHCIFYRRPVVLLFMTLTCLSLSVTSQARALHLAVASNFIAPIKQLAMEFQQETGNDITLSFGSSGKLFAQIQHGAPFDIFLSADVAKPEALIKNRLAEPNSLVIYAKGKLALWSVHPMTGSLEDVLQRAHRIAIANPKLAPYGKAAKESLMSLSQWDTVKTKIVQGENIGQTYQFVYSQNADIGFVAYSQVLAGDIKGDIIAIPSQRHSKINQAAVVVSQSKNKELAKQFMAFLMRPDIQTKIARFGYSTAAD
ncbi:molybdate ABC transporter substrate-binding protein [Marinomonas pontica]|uniref:molybdate ABC transporter substrate-binding protein n=1 Tax=Marinomonas pontica TaxID=264739 RepID=UPI0022449F08|nr:molybdate ABC transporter substrate-binding protein [Marinomonas pontica]MCW8355800.1 molybdate ABC transporter substrate-binding protein [Marinomonas pontica]